MSNLAMYVLVVFLNSNHPDYAKSFAAEFQGWEACQKAGDELITNIMGVDQFMCLQKWNGKIAIKGKRERLNWMSEETTITHEYPLEKKNDKN